MCWASSPSLCSGAIRRMLPYFGGVDLAPVVLLLLLWFIRYSLAWLVMGY